MANDIKITSSLLNSDEMRAVKRSLIRISKIDGKEKFRIKSLEYMNDSYDNDKDEFFYSMLEFIRFLHPDDQAVAYTTPDHLIYLNSPGKIGENVRHWDFIYCHECLHQAWDTFDVGRKLQANGVEYNHMILNIASDCVINDYLARIRKKEHSDGLITPEYLKEKFDVEYNPKRDTQYSLYMKLIEKKDELENDPLIQQVEFDGKITPKSVQKANGDLTPPPMPTGKHSPDYIKGWTDAIQDVLDKKFDPLKDTPKSTGNDEYDAGYSDCMDNIKEGLENGITMSDSKSGGTSGDLPQIPWDVDNDSTSDGDSDSDSKGQSGNSNDTQNSDKSSDDANSAEDAASNAKDSANKAQTSANNAGKNARAAQKAADEAKDAADNGTGSEEDAKAAQQEANDAKKAADRAKQAAKKAREAANEAQAAARDAKAAADAGDKAGEELAAKRAKAAAADARNAEKVAEGAEQDSAGENGQQQQSNSNDSTAKPGGKDGDADLGDEIDWKAKGDKIIEKYKNTLSGPLADFFKKCKSSAKLEKNGLTIGTTGKGTTSWNEKLQTGVNAFVKRKIYQKRRRYEATYSRIKRGSGYVKYGEPIAPGKKVKENAFPLNVAFYIDRSGSMQHSLEKVFSAARAIGDALTKHFKREPLIDRIEYRQWVFDTRVKELAWGKTCTPDGCTLSFEELLEEIESRSKTFLINVIITDAGFNSINMTKVKHFLEIMEGKVFFVCNPASPEIAALAKDTKYSSKLEYILADANFDINSTKNN